MLAGAITQLIPDSDFVFGIFLDPSANVLAHRGFTHSFLFAFLFTAFFSWTFNRLWGQKAFGLPFWSLFVGFEVLLHDFLDAFNAYGTGWFEPFSHIRISFNTLFVADPFFSIPVGVAAVVLLLLRSGAIIRRRIAVIALSCSACYIAYGVFNKWMITDVVERSLAAKGVSTTSYFTTPTPFNNWLWFAVATDHRGSYVGYRSVFDSSDGVDFRFFPKNDSLLRPVDDQTVIDRLKRFSQGHYTVELQGDTLIFNDLRFGQMLGWQNPRAGFVFHYFLSPPLDNTLVLQRGRFEGWNRAATTNFLQRIKGN